MKWIVIALLLAGLISCGDDEPTVPAYIDSGEVSVTLNGSDFLSQFNAGVRGEGNSPCYPNRFHLIVDYYDTTTDTERMGFSIMNVPFELGTYDIQLVTSSKSCLSDTVTGSFGTSVADGDANGDLYLPMKEEKSQITLTSYNSSSQEVEGTFDVSYVITEDHRFNKTLKDAPDTIRLTNGKFKVRYDIN